MLKLDFDKKKKERLLLQIEVEEKRKKQYEEMKRKEEEKEKQERDKKKLEEEKKRLHLNYIHSQLIREIKLCADEKPCPKCNELAILIVSLSPNARSLLAQCEHCRHEYRIKMEPDNPKVIIDDSARFFL